MIFGKHDDITIEQFKDVESRAVKAALMADGHKGYVMPIGGVAAYDNQVSPVGIGFDIACGNCAVKTNLKYFDVKDKLPELAQIVVDNISFGLGRKNNSADAPINHDLFKSDWWNFIPDDGDLMLKATDQLGTVGGGNHYVDIFRDGENSIWIGVHFGSRGFGWNVAAGFLNLSMGKNWKDRPEEKEVLLDLNSDLGRQYWCMMELCGQYAYAGREWVCKKLAQLFGAEIMQTIHNNHNFAWRETHEIDGVKRDLVVIRKGATPAFPGQLSFVGGSMGDISVIIKGSEKNSQTQRDAMYSTVHGAGRSMSRSMAKGNRSGKRKGLITRQMMSEHMNALGIIVRGGDVDESPFVYRKLMEVLQFQGDTIEIVHYLQPLVVVMAGIEDMDPYRD